MHSAGIICEYNPFHKGHLRQTELLRQKGTDTVVCLMSGNVTQRGSFALADRYTRAEAALMSGVDLVLELPYPYSAASAEYFAAAGVCLLDAFEVDEINFGSESGDLEALRRAAEASSDTAFAEAYRRCLSEQPNLGSAAAYSEANRKLTGEGLPESPNDILAISYLRAAYRAKTETPLTATRRVGTGYSETGLEAGAYPSATGIRELIGKGELEAAYDFMPQGAAKVFRQAKEDGLFPSDSSRIDSAVLSFFRLAEAKALENITEVGGGLCERLISSAKTATSLDEFFALAATKRYTSARIRRAVMFCLTGVTATDLRQAPSYVTLLAANRRGRAFLADNKSGFTVVTKPADAPDCRQTELSRRADALYTLTLPKPLSAEAFLRCSPKISEND